MRYIEIINWSSFQHYRDKRTPTWIKLHVSLTKPYDRKGKKKFWTMADAPKLTFVMLLCERAHFDHGIPYEDDTQLKKLLGIHEVELQPLVDNGYIEIGTEPYQNGTNSYQNGTQEQDQYTIEKEKEKEQDKEEKPKIVDWENNSSFSLKLGLDLDEKISKGFKPFTDKEVVTFERIRQHLVRWANKHNTESRVHTIEGMIEASHKAGVKSPKAMFVSLVKKHAGYTGTGVIL